MRKLSLILSLFAALSLNAASYGIMINGSDYHAGTENPTPVDPSFQEYMVLGVSVSNGSTLQLWDQDNNAGWAVSLDGASVSTIIMDGDHYKCTADGCYDFYIKLKYKQDQLYIGACEGGEGGGSGGGGGEIPGGQDYATAVPSQCDDVILQAFYWNSNVNSGYGDTKWATLSGQVAEISNYFTMVWLPPSAQASGISQGGLGYIPLEYSSQACLMGKRAALESLISAFHNNGVRVIADIVINHIGNPEGNCTLKQANFGSYGSFTPTKDWLTSNDEGGCGSNGNADDGQHDANYPSARDWDHKNSQVQNMCKAYLKWMKGEMKYDGFRYDYVGGFHVSHINDYNTASKPYFSVIEYWYGDANVLKQRIDEAGKNTLAFDFAAKYTAFRDGIFNKNYNNCKGAGLRGKGYSKYAVTFIDNHDTFNRGSDNEDVANKRDGSSINDKSLMMRCNAYLLSMPGVPCVFYPHWVKYKSEIQKMISARRNAGIHSESSVSENSGSDWYEATIQGKYGSVVLYLGSSASKAAPQGYKEAVKGADYAMYYTGEKPQEQGVEEVATGNSQSPVKKVLRDGHLYILRDGCTYTVTGTKIQ